MSLPKSARTVALVVVCAAVLAGSGWRAAPAAPQTGSTDTVPGVGVPDQVGIGKSPDQSGVPAEAAQPVEGKKVKHRSKSADAAGVPAQAGGPPATDGEPSEEPAKARHKARKADSDGTASDAATAEDAAKEKEAAKAAAQEALVTSLRQGGYSLVVRHAETAVTAPDKVSADPDNENLERQLDDKGKEAAKMLGVVIRALDIPIGELLSSPAYRARETVAETRFGEPVVEPALDEGGQGMAGAADKSSTAWLKQTVAKLPRRGTNRLIVTHLPVIVAAFGKEEANVAPAETLVVKPDGEGDSTVVGRLTIEDFEKLAGK